MEENKTQTGNKTIMKEVQEKGHEIWLTQEETAFYDALSKFESVFPLEFAKQALDIVIQQVDQYAASLS